MFSFVKIKLQAVPSLPASLLPPHGFNTVLTSSSKQLGSQPSQNHHEKDFIKTKWQMTLLWHIQDQFTLIFREKRCFFESHFVAVAEKEN